MESNPKEIYSERELEVPVSKLYEAFSNPTILKKWWGPEGFSNTIHEFDLRPGGKWLLTMHGPEKGNYENSSVFTEVVPLEKVAWTRKSQPWFDMEIEFVKLDTSLSKISFRMIFNTAEECNKIKKFAGSKNEENFDRLEKVIINMNQ